MKSNPSKQYFSNKSGTLEKKPSNLVVRTTLENAFDSRWAEVKIEGKNISSRSNHVAAVFGDTLFVHGGYDVERGILGDFHSMQLSETCQEFIWKVQNNQCDGKVIKLKSHTGVIYKQNLILFGGEIATGISSNTVYAYNFTTKSWKSYKPNINIPKLDSHCAALVGSKMLVYGGYMSESAEYMTDILSLDLSSYTWEVFYKGGKENQPKGRASFSMVEDNQHLFVFGGTDGVKTLNDLWIFDVKIKQWKNIETKDTPEPRRGHSMVKYENFFFMFGGIQDVTKQKNDIYILQLDNCQWSKIHTTTNSIYDCSLTLRKSDKKNKSPDQSPKRISPQKSDRGENVMKKILIQNKQKRFMEKKKELLRQFSQQQNEGKPKKKRQLSPTTEAMLKTLEAIGNQDAMQKQLKQEIVYDESHRFIIGKKPCARDGQSISILNGKMCIFGGDRHLMAFNDLYQFDLTKGVKSLEIYKHSS